jgi:acyl carrier protein
MNRAGKVDRSQLHALHFADAAPAAHAAPVMAIAASRHEVLVRRLWSDVFGHGPIRPDSNFFDLGGTSLQLMRVHAGLETALGRSIDVTALFSHPTIGRLAYWLDGGAGDTGRANEAAKRAVMSRRAVAGFRRNAS